MNHQDENDFDISDDDNIIDRLFFKINHARVRVNTMVSIDNLPITNENLLHNLLSRLPIRDDSIVSSLTGSSGKVVVRRKGGRKKSTKDKIKNSLNYYGSPSQKILTIKAVLKDLIFSAESNHIDVVNIEKELPTIVNLLSKIKNRNNDIETSDINTRRRVKTRRRLISNTDSDYSVDQVALF